MVTAADFGDAVGYKDGIPLGPGVSNCSRFDLANQLEDPIVAIEVFVNKVVMGIIIKKKNKQVSFGSTDLRDSYIWTFDERYPLIGLFGYSGLDYINGLSFITYNLWTDCQTTGEDGTSPSEEEEGKGEDKDNTTDESGGKKDEEVDAGGAETVVTPEVEEEKGMDIATIGMYTGGVLVAILIIFIIVMIVEKIRKKHKRITEVVEFKPVDLDKHFKGIEERNKIAKSKALASRKPPKP